MSRKFAEGEKYRPTVAVEKTKKGQPTAITVSGRRFIYDPGTVSKHTKRRMKYKNRQNR